MSIIHYTAPLPKEQRVVVFWTMFQGLCNAGCSLSTIGCIPVGQGVPTTSSRTLGFTCS